MIELDRERTYYHVVGADPGVDRYEYIHDAHEQLAAATGPLRARAPIFELEPIERIGRWCHLGSHVRRVRIAPEAEVRLGTPLSQGGCYTYNASAVEVLDTIDYATLMREPGIDGSVLRFGGYHFTDGFAFPPTAYLLMLLRCTSDTPLALPAIESTLVLRDCDLVLASLPATVRHDVEATSCIFRGIVDLPAARSRSIEDCTFVAR